MDLPQYKVTGIVSIENLKYLHNLLRMPVVLIFFLIGVLMILFGIGISLLEKPKGDLVYRNRDVLTVLSLFLTAGYNNVVLSLNL